MTQGFELMNKGIDLIFYHFYTDVFLNWKWWLLLSLSIFPWLLVYKWIEKEKQKQYIISTLITIIIASFLDIVGLTYDLWRYFVYVIPILGGFLPWNFSVIPVAFILTYELFPTVYPVIKGLAVSLGFAYIGQPLADYLGFTLHHHWRHTYSVPFTLFVYLLSYYGGKKLSQKAASEGKEPHDVVDDEEWKSRYKLIFDHSFDAIYVLEKKHTEKNFCFTKVNDSFCKQMGYSQEEVLTLDPRLISDTTNYNVDIKYKPLRKNENIHLDTTLVTKEGDKRFVHLFVKLFEGAEKVEIFCIAKFLPNEVTDSKAN